MFTLCPYLDLPTINILNIFFFPIVMAAIRQRSPIRQEYAVDMRLTFCLLL